MTRLLALEGIDGAGKSTLGRALRDALGGSTGLVTRPAAHILASFRQVAESPDDESVLYQDVIPPDLRRLAQLIELAVQLRYRADAFTTAGVVVFDRWVQTAAIYCGGYGAHREWLERIEADLPRPTPLFHVRVPAELAVERLVARGDRWARIYPRPVLEDKVARLVDAYDEVFATCPHVPLDGTAPPGVLLAEALAAVEAGVSRGP
ncbi:MAG: thymidylate kinase [Frankia sp.]